MGYYPRLRDLREDRDLSIRKLADIMHLQRTTYHNYETGKRDLPFELAVTFANFYGVSLDYIAGVTNNPEIQHNRKTNRKASVQFSPSTDYVPNKATVQNPNRVVIDKQKSPALFLLSKTCQGMSEPQINRLISYAESFAKEKSNSQNK